MGANYCQEYLRMHIQTASREKLVLMLFEGVLRFCDQAQAALARKDFEVSHQNLIRCQDIILELAYGLNRDEGNEIAVNLARLYGWCLHCLVQANLTRDPAQVEAVKRVFHHLREAWQGAMEKLKQQSRLPEEKPAAAPAEDSKKPAAVIAATDNFISIAHPASPPPAERRPRLSVQG